MAKKDLKAVQVGKDWYSVAQVRGKVEGHMESKPGRAPNSTTERMADRREECAM